MKKIIISRTDNIGDVMLSLPIAGFLKNYFGENTQLYFIGKKYTKSLIETSENIDEFLEREAVIENPSLLRDIDADCIIHLFPDKAIALAAYKANIKIRIGTSHRFFHWFYCNRRVNFSRKKSNLHEAQLNFKLLQPLGIDAMPTLQSIPDLYGFKKVRKLPQNLLSLLQADKMNIIFHPKSKGSAREWPVENYMKLAEVLYGYNIRIFITGTSNEGDSIRKENKELFLLPNVVDMTGKLSLEELISFINACDGLVACSTGPLHISAALGKNSLGIYPPMKPIHPGRWAPIGTSTYFVVLPIDCSACKKTMSCKCIRSIKVENVASLVNHWKRDFSSNG